MKQVIIYTDGACRGNPGPGGWGALIKFDSAEKEIYGGQANTTNNQMELAAAIEGLASLKESCSVQLFAVRCVADVGDEHHFTRLDNANEVRGLAHLEICGDASRLHAPVLSRALGPAPPRMVIRSLLAGRQRLHVVRGRRRVGRGTA